jgi:hypothetical protein
MREKTGSPLTYVEGNNALAPCLPIGKSPYPGPYTRSGRGGSSDTGRSGTNALGDCAPVGVTPYAPTKCGQAVDPG